MKLDLDVVHVDLYVVKHAWNVVIVDFNDVAHGFNVVRVDLDVVKGVLHDVEVAFRGVIVDFGAPDAG